MCPNERYWLVEKCVCVCVCTKDSVGMGRGRCRPRGKLRRDELCRDLEEKGGLRRVETVDEQLAS